MQPGLGLSWVFPSDAQIIAWSSHPYGNSRRRNGVIVITSSLVAGTRLYPNYTNYLYEISDVAAGDRYLLFNPSIHYWIATDELGATLIREMEGAELDDIKDRLTRRYGIDEPTFIADIVPFVENLVELGFLAREETPKSIGWVPDDFELQDPKRFPFNDLFVSLVDDCNLNCAYCFNKDSRVKRLRRKSTPTLAPETIIRAMKEFRELGGTGVCFTGGEPTLYPQLLELCLAGKQMGLGTQFITNGTNLKLLDAELLVEAVDGFAVSLDTLDRETAARLWGTSRYDIREEILAPLVKIVKLADARGKEFGLSIKPIVASINYDKLQPMVEEMSGLLAGHRVSWDFGRYQSIGNDKVDRFFEVSEEVYLQTMIDCVETLFPDYRQRAGQDESRIAREDGYEALRLVLGRGGSSLPRREMKIMPCVPSFFVVGSGDVYPCQELEMDEFRLGNLADSSLEATFHHPAFVGLRERMTVDDIEVCGDCQFRYVCARHCHGEAQQRFGRTTAFTHGDDEECRQRVIKQLWLETREH